MTTLKAEKRIEKLTGKKVNVNENGQRWVRLDNGYIISFQNNGRFTETSEAVCFYTRNEKFDDDYQTDYFAGTFHENLTQAVKFVINR